MINRISNSARILPEMKKKAGRGIKEAEKKTDSFTVAQYDHLYPIEENIPSVYCIPKIYKHTLRKHAYSKYTKNFTIKK